MQVAVLVRAASFPESGGIRAVKEYELIIPIFP